MSKYAPYIGNGLVGLAAVLWIAQLFLPDQGVGFVTGAVIYLIGWWMVFFTVLPLGVRGQAESGEIVPGTEPGAPIQVKLGAKMWLTAQIMAGLWLVYFIAFEFGFVSLDTFQFAAPPAEYS